MRIAGEKSTLTEANTADIKKRLSEVEAELKKSLKKTTNVQEELERATQSISALHEELARANKSLEEEKLSRKSEIEKIHLQHKEETDKRVKN